MAAGKTVQDVAAFTGLRAGTDNQVFCYDTQNRLVWAGSQGTPSCGTSLTTGTLNTGNVRYTQTYAYDVLDRLTTGPKGSGYTYGDTHHLDVLTTAPSYSASYDAAGDMTGRSGNVLGYNALRQLITWQNQATSPTQTASYAYNGSGERVQQSVTSSGTTTTTSYIGAYEEVSVTGGTTTTTKYYSAGLATVVNVNGTLSYLVNDTLGSVSASLTAAGGVQATELYTPYGSVRYSSGTMPTSYGYTKQRQDPSGLNYDHARYYDASVGQFISADGKQGPNRYVYVAGNPETNTDPTGNNVGMRCPDGDCASVVANRRAAATQAQAQEMAFVRAVGSRILSTISHPTHGGSGSTGGSGTGGSGGSGGENPTKPLSTTGSSGGSNSGASGPVVTNCDVSCQIDNAKNVVSTTKGVFDNDVWGLGAVTAALIALGAVLAAEAVADFASFWLIPLGVTVTALIVQIGEFAAMIGALAVEAGKISSLLGDQLDDQNPAD